LANQDGPKDNELLELSRTRCRIVFTTWFAPDIG